MSEEHAAAAVEVEAGRCAPVEGWVAALGGLVLASLVLGPRLLDPMTSEEAAGVHGGPWWRLLTGYDAPTNPPVMLWIANALADGPAVVDVGRALAVAGSTATVAGVGWIVGRRAGWALGLVAVALVALLPPLAMDGARVRGYGPACAAIVGFLGAWLRVAEDGGSGWRRVRVLAGGLAVYAHYLAAPVLLALGAGLTSGGPRMRRHLRELAWIPVLWAPTLGWILGDGNPPRVAESSGAAVVAYVLGMSAKRAPLDLAAWESAWTPAVAVAVMPVGLLLLGPLRDARARGLRRGAALSVITLLALSVGLLVRAPAAVLVLPGVAIAWTVGLASVGRVWAALSGVVLALWVGSAAQHALRDDPRAHQADGKAILTALEGPSWNGQTVHVPDPGVFLRLDLLQTGLPFDEPSRGLRDLPWCVDTAGARLCRGVPEPGAPFLRELPATASDPPGCAPVVSGRGWRILTCG